VSSKFAVDSLLEIVEKTSFSVPVLSFFALAIGTSLPELVVSYKALKKGHGDILVGGIIGSCMFNLLLIGGVASTIRTQYISPELVGWTIAGLAVSSLLLMTGSISKRIHLWEGFMYMLIYVAIAGKIIQS
jgi:cation:H+ antiporter